VSRAAALMTLALLAPAAYGTDDYDALFQKHGAATGVDWRLLKAVGTAESHLNPRAVNQRDPSIGIMQVRCVDDKKGGCANRLDVLRWPPARREQLYDPDYNIDIGAQILAWNIARFGRARGIAAYNHWGARRTPRSQPFPNQYYVDKVTHIHRQLQPKVQPQ
jgi:soluble lytic murein transglycosylase-like protein